MLNSKKTMKYSVIICTISFLFTFLTGCRSEEMTLDEEYKYVFRLAESHPYEHPTTQADLEFARRVYENTNGRITIEVFYDQALGEEKEVIEQLRFGAIDFARVSVAPMSEIVDGLKLVQLPYLYRDSEHMWSVLESDIGNDIFEEMSQYGFIGFTWYDGGARSFYNSQGPIHNIDDLKNMRIRIMQSELMEEFAEALGFEGVQLPYGQVYSGLQQGTIDGAENNYSSYLTASHYKVAKYYTVDEHLRVPEVVIGSAKALEALDQNDIALIKQIAQETTIYQRALWEEMEIEAREELETLGVEINVLSDKSLFINALDHLYEVYKEKYGDIIDQIREQ